METTNPRHNPETFAGGTVLIQVFNRPGSPLEGEALTRPRLGRPVRPVPTDDEKPDAFTPSRPSPEAPVP